MVPKWSLHGPSMVPKGSFSMLPKGASEVTQSASDVTQRSPKVPHISLKGVPYVPQWSPNGDPYERKGREAAI